MTGPPPLSRHPRPRPPWTVTWVRELWWRGVEGQQRARQGKARVLGECALEKKDEERVPRGMQSRRRRFLAKALGKLKLPLTRGGEACFLRLGN